MKIPTIQEYTNENKTPEILFWVGCAGSFDQRAQSITKAICLILEQAGIHYAILGNEEKCTGDPARRAGNEFLFQVMAQQNIQTLTHYQIKKIVTACPHCFNTLKNEYPDLGGHYEVIHHSELIQELLNQGIIRLQDNHPFKGHKISYHDSCYLGRSNNIYEAPRNVLEKLDSELVELKHCKKNGLCCGAGGAQMFKEEEKGVQTVQSLRVKEIIDRETSFVATACPFCKSMLRDGMDKHSSNANPQILDIAELVARSLKYQQ